ncbi:lipoprotein LpqB [Actinomyces bovis]|uniref:Lipoprotein LpqB n=1 Tax=Actinomyces bovis TaxID=1658 RepID=A0ABY1VMP4_9ACTO|nr:GerMN domain-containing protein [Actinomyces bovis]SPT53335.1 lipoprotein LpqB [Actinomyces bovis]VEG52695.1 lipoprotein LpqB [Actinomyces israelii]
MTGAEAHKRRLPAGAAGPNRAAEYGPARRSFLLALATAGTAGLSGCVTLPSSGKVQRADVRDQRPDSLIQTADFPLVGAEPTEIVAGFLRACASGPSDDFAAARRYLVGPVASSWWPERTVRVYPHLDSTSIVQDQSGAVQVSVPVQAQLDAEGNYEVVAEDNPVQVSYTLTRNARNEWRIAAVPDGVMLPVSSFSSNFQCLPVFFLGPDGTHWVADSRWVPSRNAVSRVVSRILGGPSDRLKGVATALALEGMEMEDQAGLTAVNGLVTVGLRSQDRQPAGLLSRLASQITLSLSVLETVTEVHVVVNGERVAADSKLPNPLKGSGQVVLLTPSAVVRGVGGTRVALADLASLGGSQLRSPAVGPDNSVYALNGGSLLRLAAGANSASVIYSTANPQGGSDSLLPPVVDADGWVWTGRDGQLSVVNAKGAAHNLKTDWLVGKITAFDLSAEGGRVAVVASTNQGVRVAVCAVKREGEDAHPAALVQPQYLVAPGATKVAWADLMTVAVLMAEESGGGTLRLQVVGGSYEDVAAVKDTTVLAGERTNGTILACDARSVLWRRSGATWHEIDAACSDPYYPLPGA